MRIQKSEGLTQKDHSQLSLFIENMIAENQHEYKLEDLVLGESERYTYLVGTEEEKILALSVISQFEADEVEATLVTPNDEASIQQLLTATLEEMNSRKVKKQLLIVEANDKLQEKLIQENGFTHDFTELGMMLAVEKLMTCSAKALDASFAITQAKPEEILTVLQMWNPAATSTDVRLSEKEISENYLLKKENELIATMRITENSHRLAIYGFIVKEEYRGKGIGRSFLENLLVKVQAAAKPIYLEVESENIQAKNLYSSLGFEQMAEFKYYKK